MGRNDGEAVVVCSDNNMGTGMTVWDIATGDSLIHIPCCASPPRALLCLKNLFLVASQIQRPGSVSGGVITMWPLNKPQQSHCSYPVEAIVALACTKDGVYLAGGASSGNAYLWEVNGGKLLKTWRVHSSSLNCMLFSDDGARLMSGADDGMICVWSLMSLLEAEDCRSFPSLLMYSMDHESSVTGMSATSGSSRMILVSSSLDGSVKIWDLSLGKLLQTHVYPISVTAIVLSPTEQLIYSGGIDGRIFVKKLEIELVEDDPLLTVEDQDVMLKGHNGSISALTFCRSGLISASEDCTICIWDVNTGEIIRRFNHPKGPVTNLAVIPKSAMLPGSNQRKGSSPPTLEKYPQPASSSRRDMSVTLASPIQASEEDHNSETASERHIHEMEKDQTLASMEMKLERCLAEQTLATKMANHIMEMNAQLQSRLLDMMQSRLSMSRPTEEADSPPPKKKSKTSEVPEDPPSQDSQEAKES